MRDSIARTINPSKWTCLNTVWVNSINGLESCFSVNFVIWLSISDVFRKKISKEITEIKPKTIFLLIRWCYHVPEENQYVEIYIPDNINKQLRLVKLYGRLYVTHYYILELHTQFYVIHNQPCNRPTDQTTNKEKERTTRYAIPVAAANE